MTIKLWAALASNELVAHAEVRDAVNTGVLLWDYTEPATIPGDLLNDRDHYCYTREDFENYVRHTDMSASGIATGEMMSKAEMLLYRSLDPAVPGSFVVLHDDATGPPRIRMDLSWTVQPNRGTLTLQRRIGDVGNYSPLTVLAQGTTSYVDDFIEAAGAVEGDRIHYRIRYSDQPATHWAESSDFVFWPI
ncbi:hypothetical protein [Mycolicibacterium sp.]|uniref:hypothetical protein n=1 Tax=Mycolicibacterium sp. TaxID=2320850 RepID=UPI00355D0C55